MIIIYPLAVIVLGFYLMHALKEKSFTTPIRKVWSHYKEIFNPYKADIVQKMIKDSWALQSLIIDAKTRGELTRLQNAIYWFESDYNDLVPYELLDSHVSRLQNNLTNRLISLQR